MTRPLQNFRGCHALIAHPADQNRLVLESTLTKLGLAVTVLDPLAGEARSDDARADVAFIDVDDAACTHLPWAEGEVPLVAMIGHESPSRLQRAFELQPSAFLLKPVRPSGVYTAIFFAINGHVRDRQIARTVASLEARHRARRVVTKAVLLVMQRQGVDDDEAYRRLRKESMRLRVTVEDLSRRIVDQEGRPVPEPDRRAGIG
jgi:two-component system, response regulator / RNA-binding antiterminator